MKLDPSKPFYMVALRGNVDGSLELSTETPEVFPVEKAGDAHKYAAEQAKEYPDLSFHVFECIPRGYSGDLVPFKR